jgi:spore coat protein CotF
MENASSLDRMFYTTSMIFCKEEETKNQIALAKISNPFLQIK